MIKREFQLQLNTPAFLGDADQKGVWRTPPLKALLREWWRVAVAAEVDFDVVKLKAREAELFGTAADEDGGENHQSRIRLALGHWKEGGLTDWRQVNPGHGGKPGTDPKVKHPEVDFGGGMVGSQLYLGYGPLVLEKGSPSPRLKSGAALDTHETNTLKLAWANDWPGKSAAYPEDVAGHMARALTLAHWFGTIGGRSRNGWGSLAFLPSPAGRGAGGEGTPVDIPLPRLTRSNLQESRCIQSLDRCLKLDWPHAIGQDKTGPLVWQSRKRFANWPDAMQFVAQTKIHFRTKPRILSLEGAADGAVKPRHLLSYPLTHHAAGAYENHKKLAGWVERWPDGKPKKDKKNQWLVQAGRVASQVRFKVASTPNGLMVVVFHTPTRLPEDLLTKLSSEDQHLLRNSEYSVWQQVHAELDAQAGLSRLA